jgi:hypothetical protein
MQSMILCSESDLAEFMAECISSPDKINKVQWPRILYKIVMIVEFS